MDLPEGEFQKRMPSETTTTTRLRTADTRLKSVGFIAQLEYKMDGGALSLSAPGEVKKACA